MELKHVKGIGPAKQEKLRAAGITSVEQLARADVPAVAAASGLPEAQVREYREKATALALIQDLKGAGPATVQAIADAGIQSLKELYQASTEWLAKEAKLAREKAKALQAEARELAERVARDSKTPEGRKALAADAKVAAQKAADATQKAAREAIAFAQKEGEIVMARAKELREKAPVVAAQAKARAQEVQTKVAEAAGKAKAAVRSEAEKVKAANEQIVGKAKARFQKPPA